PDDYGADALRARTLHHTTPEVDAWLGLFRILDLFSNAHLMEFTSGLIWEGLIGLFWRLGRLIAFWAADTADVTVVDRARPQVNGAAAAALGQLHVGGNGPVSGGSPAAGDDAFPTVVTALDGTRVTLRDAVPNYPATERLRLWKNQGTTPDNAWDLNSYT